MHLKEVEKEGVDNLLAPLTINALRPRGTTSGGTTSRATTYFTAFDAGIRID